VRLKGNIGSCGVLINACKILVWKLEATKQRGDFERGRLLNFKSSHPVVYITNKSNKNSVKHNNMSNILAYYAIECDMF
jgi:ribosome-binding ATPase YchF (GTP1/OBG family)